MNPDRKTPSWRLIAEAVRGWLRNITPDSSVQQTEYLKNRARLVCAWQTAQEKFYNAYSHHYFTLDDYLVVRLADPRELVIIRLCYYYHAPSFSCQSYRLEHANASLKTLIPDLTAPTGLKPADRLWTSKTSSKIVRTKR